MQLASHSQTHPASFLQSGLAPYAPEPALIPDSLHAWTRINITGWESGVVGVDCQALLVASLTTNHTYVRHQCTGSYSIFSIAIVVLLGASEFWCYWFILFYKYLISICCSAPTSEVNSKYYRSIFIYTQTLTQLKQSLYVYSSGLFNDLILKRLLIHFWGPNERTVKNLSQCN